MGEIGTTAQKKRILVVDDHPFLREGVRRFLNQYEDLEVCGEAGDVQQATEAVERLRPDLMLLDIRLGNGDAIELIKAVRARFPTLRILVYSQHEESIFAERSLRAGAQGYLVKNETPAEVLAAVRCVLEGGLYVSRRMAGSLLNKLLHAAPGTPTNRVEGLSDREFQVFRMLGSGLTNRQISQELKLSVKTIETYRENIKHKFGLRTAAELMRHAVEWLHTSVAHAPTLPPLGILLCHLYVA